MTTLASSGLPDAPASPQDLLDFVELVLASAQAGLTFSRDPYERERCERLRIEATRLLASGADTPAEAIGRWLALDTGYPTPKLDVRALILDAGQRVLLVRENADGGWTLPGGWCDVGASPAEAVVREVAEEAGLHVAAERLLALFDKHKHAHPPQMPHAYKAFFLCRVLGGELLQATTETSGAAWFPPDQLPSLSLHRVLPEQIRRLHGRVLAGATDTLFD